MVSLAQHCLLRLRLWEAAILLGLGMGLEMGLEMGLLLDLVRL